ncbi:hypothetical protein THAOC_28011, partial [Thalassiosira oceanica]
MPWETRYDELVQYKAKHDDCNVPWDHQGKLGVWDAGSGASYVMSRSFTMDDRPTKESCPLCAMCRVFSDTGDFGFRLRPRYSPRGYLTWVGRQTSFDVRRPRWLDDMLKKPSQVVNIVASRGLHLVLPYLQQQQQAAADDNGHPGANMYKPLTQDHMRLVTAVIQSRLLPRWCGVSSFKLSPPAYSHQPPFNGVLWLWSYLRRPRDIEQHWPHNDNQSAQSDGMGGPLYNHHKQASSQVVQSSNNGIDLSRKVLNKLVVLHQTLVIGQQT